MSVVLGIDGGGTRTRASIVDGERVLALVEHGSIKRLRVGVEMADDNLRGILAAVFSKAGVQSATAACVGLASSKMPGVSEWVLGVLGEFGVRNAEVVGDEVVALDAAFKGGPGILQIAGTGTNCIGRAPDGSRESAGGWSSRLGDEGSGYWIGLHAVRRALAAHDREQHSRILETVGLMWGTTTIDELVNVGDGTPGPDFAALAPAISQLAEEGDAVAAGVLAQAAKDLVDSVLLVRAKLRRKHNLAGEVPVAWIGSVVGKARLVREPFFAGLRAAAPELPVGEHEVAGIEGAVWRAQRLAERGR
ncbi:MAG TPA: BadF/BadG/BcrA/BcrD ATPase family protein [Terracidiphilus sp.]|jgi:N-acetylglucosamine kinase-like BadF-type ATPase|nr:BadF/BadG/BcrA/BcrD ATPase family protein [Terracidiphilus sp.]